MATLRELEQDFPLISANFQRFCAAHGIFSVEDFLVHDIDKLVAFAEQEATAKVLKDGINQVLSIIDKWHQPWLNGVELLEDTNRNKHFLSTGCERIDMLLGGGLRAGQLTEIVGASSSGKTQVCFQVASHVVDKQLGAVIFLDACNSFSPNRIVQISSQLSDPLVKESEERRLKRIMRNILCHSVFDIFVLLDVLRQLEHTLQHQVKGKDAGICLLIVDSISSLITPILGGRSPQGRSLMVSAGVLLKKLASGHNLAVLVTNHMVSGEGGIPKPALGESWKSIPHVRLLLSRDQGSSICNLSILKHTFMVQHLIEKCLLFHMNKEECMEALSKHANIEPVITSTVWTELEKENREFFEKYTRDREERALEMEAMQRIQKMLQEWASRDRDDED